MFNNFHYSDEEIGLYNPAYVGALLYISIREFCTIKDEGMHYAIPFVVIPLAMNSEIVTMLPPTITTPIASWVSVNEGVIYNLAEHARAFNPIVSTSIKFLLERNLLSINKEGNLILGDEQLPKSSSFYKASPFIKSNFRAASFLGRWLSHASDTETIFIHLGIRP